MTLKKQKEEISDIYEVESMASVLTVSVFPSEGFYIESKAKNFRWHVT